MRVNACVFVRATEYVSNFAHAHTGAKIGHFHVTAAVKQHVIRFDVAVQKAHTVNGVETDDHFGRIELGPGLANVVGGH